ncbi:MAG: hypothetical protein ACRBI6_21510, partial [Acidimicrobiales bacterium]
QGSTDDVNSTAAGSQLYRPRGIALDPDGNLYIADTNNQRIRMVAADRELPAVDLSGTSVVADGASVTNGSTATLGFTCTDTGTSGLDTCTATLDGNPITAGDALDTTTEGAHTVTVTAVDLAGNTTTETITYTVLGSRQLTGDYAETSGTNGSVARLYMAVFNRQPDGTGYQFWVNAHDNGDWTL